MAFLLIERLMVEVRFSIVSFSSENAGRGYNIRPELIEAAMARLSGGRQQSGERVSDAAN